ncbi:unnamed protein product, partial [Phaeothamnion confervicola]
FQAPHEDVHPRSRRHSSWFHGRCCTRAARGYLKLQDDPETRGWLHGPFFKAVRKANAKEFERGK